MNEKMNATLGSAFPKERVRYAMLSFFLAQGLCFSSWASRIPDVKDFFEVNYAFYWGLVLFLIPVGKFVAIPLAGYLVSKLGSRIMAQVTGYRGETKTLEQMEGRVKRDVWYLENWSFFLDLKIIVLTVVNMFKGEKNAY
jgi:hypothetical protein